MLYLTPASLGYLTQLILALMITAYFVAKLASPRASRPAHMRLLAGFFACVTLLALLFFLEASLLPTLRLYALFLQNTALGAGIVLLLQFAYCFPAQIGPKWERLIVMGLSSMYASYEAIYAAYRFWLILTQGQVVFRPEWADYPMALSLLWAPLLFVRQSLRASGGSTPLGFLLYLVRPQGRAARAARALALVYLLPFGLSLLTIQKTFMLIPANWYQLSLSMGLMITLAAFAVVYLNYLPETTTFMVKLVGVTLLALLAVLGAVGWVITPQYAEQYRPVWLDHQTLRFAPNDSGGYDATLVPFHFESELGVKLDVLDMAERGEEKSSAELDFKFPFYGKTFTQVFATNDGTISIGHDAYYRDYLYHYGGKTPFIFPILTDLIPEASQGGGIFARQEVDRLIVTWDRIPSFYQRQAVFTFQVVLRSSGVFDITYNGLPERMDYRADNEPWASVWLVGSTPGDMASWPQRMQLSQLAQGIPLGGGPHGMVQDYYLDFREYLHALLLPLAYLIGCASLLVAVVFPSLLYFNLVKPLNALVAGVRRMNTEQLDARVQAQFPDEIGFLTVAFNEMAASLQDLVANLETRVGERTDELLKSNVLLGQEIADRKQAEEALRRSTERLQLLHEIDQAILGARSPQAIARAILGRLYRLVPCQRVSVVEFSAEGEAEILAVEAMRGSSSDITWSDLLYGSVRGRPFVQGVANLAAVAQRSPLQERLYTEGNSGYLTVPLVVGDKVIGALTLEMGSADSLEQEHIDTAVQVGALLAVAIRQAQLHAALEQRTVELEAQNAELDAFAHTVAHDLKSPLTVVAAGAELLAQYAPATKSGEEQSIAQSVAKNAYRAAEIVDNLLLLASAHKQVVKLSPLDMAGIVSEVQDRLDGVIKQCQAKIITPNAETWPRALGYEPWIEQVWANYLSNALKYGGTPPCVELGATPLPGHVRFWVRDNGHGLTPEEQAKLFMPFERLSQVRVSGHGLGLSIVRRIVEKLGGQVGVESQVGQGSTFWFSLPAEQEV